MSLLVTSTTTIKLLASKLAYHKTPNIFMHTLFIIQIVILTRWISPN